ncbi:MAG: hypothetical protein H7Y00_00645 [Fimbriimonadaceae bacterium]|nr:hypothetical protein [Chitinophagales bacterium]
MKKNNLKYIAFIFIYIPLMSCNKDVKDFTYINFEFQFSETQERLNNDGEPSIIPLGNAAITPVIHGMGVNYIELSHDEFTPYKEGQIVYKGHETMEGGSLSIDFDSCVVKGAGDPFYKFNVNKLAPGTYNYVRVSVAYQNYDIQFNALNIPVVGDLLNQTGTIASFIGSRTYIRNLVVKNLSTDIYADKEQGFWAFETGFTSPYDSYNAIYTGQAPEGATTVVNPISATSPIPPGSCVVTGKFTQPLVITGAESDNSNQQDLYISLSFSISQSFEWVDLNANGEWDIDVSNPDETELVADMGVRGLIPAWEWR